VTGLYSRRLTGLGALASSLAGLAFGLAFFPDFRGVITAVPVVGDLLPAADPLYLTSFGGAFVVSAACTLLAVWLSSAEYDLDSLSDEVAGLSEPATDGGVGTDGSAPASNSGEVRER
jgi:hypothetical protein